MSLNVSCVIMKYIVTFVVHSYSFNTVEYTGQSMASGGPPEALKKIANNLVLNARTNEVRLFVIQTLVMVSLVRPSGQLLEISSSSGVLPTEVWMRAVQAGSTADQHNKAAAGC